VRFSVSIDILSAQKGAKLLSPDTFPCLKIKILKMHLRPGHPAEEAYSAPPNLLAGFGEGNGKGREREGERERKSNGGESERNWEGKEGKG